MNSRNGDINDDEIRIISSGKVQFGKKRRRIFPVLLLVAALLLTGIFCLMFFWDRDADNEIIYEEVSEQIGIPVPGPGKKDMVESPAYTTKTDTVVDGIALTILTPRNATPVLEIGNDHISDSTAVLIMQAADIREDNGGIVGSFVVDGDLKSKGEAKAGFCSIVNGELTVGVADATPMFEQATTDDGYFFRQYPLIVGGQLVENRPKGKSIRKALADINGTVCVIISRERLTYRDFSQALIDVGVRNAISLVGGSSYGRYVNADGETYIVGTLWDNDIKNVNYIVWR